MIKTTRYIRKPLYVDAIRVTEHNFRDVATWCQSDIRTDKESEKKYIRVRAINPMTPRQTRAYVGDWILYTDKGYKVYTDKTFKANFLKDEEEKVNPDQIELPDGLGAEILEEV